MKSSETIKICLVSHTMNVGGMERVMAGFANFLARKEDIEIFLILLLRKDKFFKLDKRINIIEPDFGLDEMPRWKYALRTLGWLRFRIKEIAPDTILSFGEYWNSFVLLSTIGLPFPRFISDRSNPTDNLPFLHELFRRIIYRTASGFLAQTKLAADSTYKKTGLKNIIVVGNPIRTIKIRDSERKNIIINVGRLIPFKQQSKLIEIFRRLPENNWKLQIIGDGELYEDLNELVISYNLESKVELLGRIENVDHYLMRAKIFAFTSYYEGFPNALAEGMNAGLAPISFDCPAGPADLIENGENGFLIPLNDFDAFHNGLSRLIKDKDLLTKFGINAKRSIQKYEETSVSELILSFILGHSRQTNNTKKSNVIE